MYALVVMQDYVRTTKELKRQYGEELRSETSDDIIQVWDQRNQNTQEKLEEWKSYLWLSTSPGVAAAQIQTRLSEITESVGISNNTMKVAAELKPLTQEDLGLLTFTINGVAFPGELAEFLAHVSTNKKRLILTEISFKRSRNETYQFSFTGEAIVMIDS